LRTRWRKIDGVGGGVGWRYRQRAIIGISVFIITPMTRCVCV
jgi:hypothetical protein